MTDRSEAAEGRSEYEAAVMELLTELCSRMDIDIHPEVRSTHPPYLEVELVGPDAGVSFGRHGRRLDALQYLVNLIVGRRQYGELRLVLDADGYRERRAAALMELARDCAAQVKERQEECELDPLPAHERRIIHNALADDPEVRTYSEGDESDRHIVIAPR